MIQSRAFTNLLMVLIGLVAIFRLSSITYSYSHPDEVITIKVAQRVVQEGTLDTNWNDADLPADFKYPQYNFSAYNLFAAGLLALPGEALAISDQTALKLVRFGSGLLAVAVILLTVRLGGKLLDHTTGLVAGLIVALNPLLYQDSLYARPEAFVTLLVLAYLYTLWVSRLQGWRRIAVASVILGILVATKISMLALVPLLFLADGAGKNSGQLGVDLLAYVQACLAVFSRYIWVVPCAAALGFAIGAPYAIVNFDAYLNGFRYLSEQYTTGHWPHGLVDGSSWERMAYSLAYFFPTMGIALFAFSAGGAICLLKARNFRLFFAFAFFIFFFVWFSLYRTFFERNFSHVLPLLIIIASYGVTRLIGAQVPTAKSRLVAVAGITFALLLVPPLSTFCKLRFLELPGHYARKVATLRNHLEERYGTSVTQVGWAKDPAVVEKHFASDCGPRLVELTHAGDKVFVGAVHDFSQKNGYREVAQFESPYASASPSTLHTYFSASRVYLFKAEEAQACAPDKLQFTSLNRVGDLRTVVQTRPDPAWTIGGGYDLKLDPFNSEKYFASWSGSDAGTGVLTLTLQPQAEKFVVLPIVTGPVAKNQIIEVRDHDSGKLIFSTGAVQKTLTWKQLLLPIPQQSGLIDIVARDEGASWGEWLGVGMPRKYMPDQVPAGLALPVPAR